MSLPDDTDRTDPGALLHAVHELRAEVRSARKEIRSLRRGLTRLSDQVHEKQQQQFRQVEALASLYYALRPRHPIPATRRWAASPDLLWYLYRTVREDGRTQVLECGSGVSTLVLAYALEHHGAGRVCALEHDETYARTTRDELRRHQLEGWAEVRCAPLRPVELHGQTWPWYDPATIPQQRFDLIFVDGPPGATREHARFPAVPLLLDRLADGGRIVLDDYARPDEAEVARRWLEHHPELTAQTLPHEKGTLVLARRSVSPRGASAAGRPPRPSPAAPAGESATPADREPGR